ncbi:MAG: hypothetical protein F4Z08_05595 [Chloroflexi bacterium]|nr:hypothetical protein [Chloroflexota bacterium]
MDQQMCAAIGGRHYLTFTYDGLPREIEPHAHGTSSTGKEVVRGFQTAGQSSSGELGWRMWTVAKMELLSVSSATFAETRPDYRRGDRQMHPVHCEL